MAWCGFWPINAHHNLTFILFQGTFKRHIIFFSVYLAQLIFFLSYRPIYQLQEDDTYSYFYLCTTPTSDTKHWWLRRVTLTYKGFQIQSTATSFLHTQICPTLQYYNYGARVGGNIITCTKHWQLKSLLLSVFLSYLIFLGRGLGSRFFHNCHKTLAYKASKGCF